MQRGLRTIVRFHTQVAAAEKKLKKLLTVVVIITILRPQQHRKGKKNGRRFHIRITSRLG